MTAASFLLGGSWAGLVVLAAARRRPAPSRVRALAGTTGPAARRRHEGRRQGPPRHDPLAAVGRAALRCIPARHRPPPDAARAVGAAAVAALASMAVAPALTPAVALAGWAVPRHQARLAGRRRLRALEGGVPDLVDLLVLAVGAGCNVPLALAAAGRRSAGPLAVEVRRVSAEVDGGRRLADALDDLAARTGEPVRALAAVLAACERYGAPALPALERLAGEVRTQRQRRAEAAARRVPVALLFPLVLCILPAFALLTVAPLVAGALRELRL